MSTKQNTLSITSTNSAFKNSPHVNSTRKLSKPSHQLNGQMVRLCFPAMSAHYYYFHLNSSRMTRSNTILLLLLCPTELLWPGSFPCGSVKPKSKWSTYNSNVRRFYNRLLIYFCLIHSVFSFFCKCSIWIAFIFLLSGDYSFGSKRQTENRDDGQCEVFRQRGLNVALSSQTQRHKVWGLCVRRLFRWDTEVMTLFYLGSSFSAKSGNSLLEWFEWQICNSIYFC